MLQAIISLPHVREVEEYAEMVRLWWSHRDQCYCWGYVDHSVPEWYGTRLPGWQKLNGQERLKRSAQPTTDYDDATEVATAMSSFLVTAFEDGEDGDDIAARLTVIRASHRWRRDDYRWWMRFHQQCFVTREIYNSRNSPGAPWSIQEAIQRCTAKDHVPTEGAAEVLVEMNNSLGQLLSLLSLVKVAARCYATLEPDRAAFRILPSPELVEEYAELLESWCGCSMDIRYSRELRTYTMMAWEEATEEAATSEKVDWRQVRDGDGFEAGDCGYVADTMAVALECAVELCDSVEDVYGHLRSVKTAHTRRRGDKSWWKQFQRSVLIIWALKPGGDGTAPKPHPGLEKVQRNEGTASEAERNSSVLVRSVFGNLRKKSDNSSAVSKVPSTEPRGELGPARKRAAVTESAPAENDVWRMLVEAGQKAEEERKMQADLEELLRFHQQDKVRSQEGKIRATAQKPGAREKPKETGSDMEGLIFTITDAKEGSQKIMGTISDEAMRPVLVEGQSATGEDKVTLNVTEAVLERLGDQHGEEIRKLQQEKDALTTMTRTTTEEDGHRGPSNDLDLLQRKERVVMEKKCRKSLEVQQKEEDWKALLIAKQAADYLARCAQRPEEKAKGLSDNANRGRGEQELYKRPLPAREKQHAHLEEPHGEEEVFKDATEQLPKVRPKGLSDIDGSHASDRDTRFSSDDWTPFTPTMKAEWKMCREAAAAVAEKVEAEIEARKTTPEWDEILKEQTGHFDAEGMKGRLRSRISTYPSDMSKRLRGIFSSCLASEIFYIHIRKLEEMRQAGGRKKGLLSGSRVPVENLVIDRLADYEKRNSGGSGLDKKEPCSSHGFAVEDSSHGPGVDKNEPSNTQDSLLG
ncbi:hypothetical protein GE09DRAFT_569657 [Coniochaeta sp. 2T2.1]|nr:hypothetical protein GE09DRAFT_569657 [Coniochaeta sp. 2T2.1]